MEKKERSFKGWRFCAVFWPLLCIGFAGIILYQSIQGMEERFAGDAAFTVIPLIIFAIGMKMRHRLIKERRNATVRTTAAVVSTGRRAHSGEINYFPEFEFWAGEKAYQVKYACGYSYCVVEEGQKVDLYYDPQNPNTFYVPLMQKHDKRWAAILCGVGVLWPLFGLFAPQIRALVALLE